MDMNQVRHVSVLCVWCDPSHHKLISLVFVCRSLKSQMTLEGLTA